MRIPLPKMMRHWREREFEKNLTPGVARWGLAYWRALGTRPALYRLATRISAFGLRLLAMGKGRISRLPMIGAWTDHRDFPAPQGSTFQAQWRAGRRAVR
jgi:L-lactate dehydrogenase complex protein LldF